MSTNFADAPAGDAAKGAKIFKTKYVLLYSSFSSPKNRLLMYDFKLL